MCSYFFTERKPKPDGSNKMSVPSIFNGYNTIYWSVYIVCITGAVSQVVLLICLIKDPLKCFRNSATYLVANLAVSDLAVVLEMIFGTFTSLRPHVRSFSHTSFYASILTILSIAVDRYIMVAYPFKHRSFMSGKKAAIWITFVWILSASSPLFYFLTDRLYKISEFKYGLLASVIGLTAMMYALTCISLRRQAQSLSNREERQAHKIQIAREEQFLKTIIIVAVMAVVCLTPATVYGQVMKPGLDSNMESNALYCILMTMLTVNFAINPWIYFIRLKNYRRTLFIVFCRRY